MLLWSSCQREGVGLSHRLRQRWIGLCGHATGAPAGASYTAGRAVLRDRPASPCRQQFQREKSSLPWHSGSHEKSQLIQRLPAPLLRHRLATPRREELSAGQAARELDLSRTRFYKLYSPYRPRLRSRSRRYLGARPPPAATTTPAGLPRRPPCSPNSFPPNLPPPPAAPPASSTAACTLKPTAPASAVGLSQTNWPPTLATKGRPSPSNAGRPVTWVPSGHTTPRLTPSCPARPARRRHPLRHRRPPLRK